MALALLLAALAARTAHGNALQCSALTATLTLDWTASIGKKKASRVRADMAEATAWIMSADGREPTVAGADVCRAADVVKEDDPCPAAPTIIPLDASSSTGVEGRPRSRRAPSSSYVSFNHNQ